MSYQKTISGFYVVASNAHVDDGDAANAGAEEAPLRESESLNEYLVVAIEANTVHLRLLPS